jgi:hypothetical protein
MATQGLANHRANVLFYSNDPLDPLEMRACGTLFVFEQNFYGNFMVSSSLPLPMLYSLNTLQEIGIEWSPAGQLQTICLKINIIDNSRRQQTKGVFPVLSMDSLKYC